MLNLESRFSLRNLIWDFEPPDAYRRILSTEGKVDALVQGQFAASFEDGQNHYLIRDRLGINKLFYHLDPAARRLVAGNSFFDLAVHTRDANMVRSVPAGHYLSVNKLTLETRLTCYYDISKADHGSFSLDDFPRRIDQKLASAFEKIKARFPESEFVVCLSGGLDSSVVAGYAKKFLGKVTAASFSFPDLSEDFKSAEAIAGILEIPFLPIVSDRDFNPETLDEVLDYGQDWRDFNVHCAWVNNILGRELRKRFGSAENVVLLTGDLMNEFVADYAPVNFSGSTYYALPKISRGRLRKFLVYGLDSGDREVGVFDHHGFVVIQPYAFVAEEYLSVPDALLEKENCKEILNLPLLSDDRIQQFIQKKKLRAQVGGKGGGTLGLFHEHGVSQEDIANRWTRRLSPYSREGEARPFIAAGRYVS